MKQTFKVIIVVFALLVLAIFLYAITQPKLDEVIWVRGSTLHMYKDLEAEGTWISNNDEGFWLKRNIINCYKDKLICIDSTALITDINEKKGFLDVYTERYEIYTWNEEAMLAYQLVGECEWRLLFADLKSKRVSEIIQLLEPDEKCGHLEKYKRYPIKRVLVGMDDATPKFKFESKLKEKGIFPDDLVFPNLNYQDILDFDEGGKK